MFIKNKYYKYYYSIINASKSREISTSVYTEKHHIIPKSLGGGNFPENIAILTAREHFICHLLLIKFTDGQNKHKMSFAAMRLSRSKNKIKLSSRSYEILKMNWSIAQKAMWANTDYRKNQSLKHKKLWKNPTYRKQILDSIKKYWGNPNNRLAASKRTKLRNSSLEYREQQSQTQKKLHLNHPEIGAKKSLPGKQNGMYGKKHSSYAKEKISENTIKHLKGKSYEHLHGAEKATRLKIEKSKKLKEYHQKNKDIKQGKSNGNSKKYKFINAVGEIYIVEGNLKLFCKQNNLSVGAVIDCAKGRRKLYKGWAITYSF